MEMMRLGVAFETPLGRCALGWTGAGVALVELPGPRADRAPRIEDAAAVPAFVRDAVAGIRALLGGASVGLGDVPLDDRSLDPFRRSVSEATRRIPPGSTTTYGEIARAIGRTDARGARDVGTALSRNPFPILVPCHRVIASNGALTGFSAAGGIETKRRILELEGAPGFGQQRLFG
jgi:methylated-DNA-[protein]-cysteine S-methyltransferase